MWIDLIDTMMHIEGQGEDGGSRVLAAMWLPSWQRAAAKIGATPKLQHFQMSLGGLAWAWRPLEAQNRQSQTEQNGAERRHQQRQASDYPASVRS
jgi:hypothetical protein